LKTSRYNFLVETEKEKEGYTKSVKSLLIDCEKTKELGKGMHGVLASVSVTIFCKLAPKHISIAV